MRVPKKSKPQHRRDLSIINMMIGKMENTKDKVHVDDAFVHRRGCRLMIRTAAKAMGFTFRELAALEHKLEL